MNERMKALQDKVLADAYQKQQGMDWAMEKLAELIVRECVRHFNEDYQRDFDTLWREDLSKSIKEHFGVE